jgi:xanthine phosphoribosyltransferase
MSQPKFITNPTYDMLHSAAITMTREARTLGKWIDCVAAPVKGGLLFGMIAATKLNVPLVTLHYSSKAGKGDDKNHANTLQPIDCKTILLVDDIIDSGETMKEIVDHYTSQGHVVVTAVFHFKETAVFHPDLYFWQIPGDSEFIQYSWEHD